MPSMFASTDIGRRSPTFLFVGFALLLGVCRPLLASPNPNSQQSSITATQLGASGLHNTLTPRLSDAAGTMFVSARAGGIAGGYLELDYLLDVDLSIGYIPTDWLELFVALRGRRADMLDGGTDINFGASGWWRRGGWVVGSMVQGALLSGIDTLYDLSATSGQVRLVAGYDVLPAHDTHTLSAYVNTGFAVDNTAALYDVAVAQETRAVSGISERNWVPFNIALTYGYAPWRVHGALEYVARLASEGAMSMQLVPRIGAGAWKGMSVFVEVPLRLRESSALAPVAPWQVFAGIAWKTRSAEWSADDPMPVMRPRPRTEQAMPDAAPQVARLRGVVRGKAGEPLEAWLRIVEPRHAARTYRVEGEFDVPLTVGRVVVDVVAQGYEPEQLAVTTQSGEAIERDVTLVPVSSGTALAVVFSPRRAALRADAKRILDKVVDEARKNSAIAVAVIGHAHEMGDDAANLDMSRRRAVVVARYLRRRGIAAERIRIMAFGESEPLVNHARRADVHRRVDIQVLTQS